MLEETSVSVNFFSFLRRRIFSPKDLFLIIPPTLLTKHEKYTALVNLSLLIGVPLIALILSSSQ